MESYKFCPNCGSPNVGKPFCPNCGERYPEAKEVKEKEPEKSQDTPKFFAYTKKHNAETKAPAANNEDYEDIELSNGIKVKKRPDYNFEEIESDDEPAVDEGHIEEDSSMHTKHNAAPVISKELAAEDEKEEKKPFWAKSEHKEDTFYKSKDVVYQEKDKYDANGVYDPNYDKYYDDVLPDVINEINKFPKEAVVKIAFGIIALVGAILYCVYVM